MLGDGVSGGLAIVTRFLQNPGNGSGLFAGKPARGRKNQMEAMEVKKLKIGTSGEIVAGPQKGLFVENRESWLLGETGERCEIVIFPGISGNRGVAGKLRVLPVSRKLAFSSYLACRLVSGENAGGRILGSFGLLAVLAVLSRDAGLP